MTSSPRLTVCLDPLPTGLGLRVAGMAPTHDAARDEDLAEVQRLVEGDPGLLRAVDEDGLTAFSYAAEFGHVAVVAYHP